MKKASFPLIVYCIPLLFLFLYGCLPAKELPAEFTSVRLVKLDTLYRYQGSSKLMLVWESTRDAHVRYYSLHSMENHSFAVGLTIPILQVVR